MIGDGTSLLRETLASIRPADAAAREAAEERWAGVAMPLHGLGVLQDDVCRIAAAQGSADVEVGSRRLAVFCADNGVVAEGVSQSGPEVTTAVARNLCDGATSSCRMGERAGCPVSGVDVGMLEDVDDPRLLVRKRAHGTGDVAEGPAMSRDDAIYSIEGGIELAKAWAGEGARLLLAGEMGIGNTTTSSAVACALLDEEPSFMTGRGAGLSSEGLSRKVKTVERALEVNCPDPDDAIDVIAKVGGFDIAAMCGFYLGCAASHVPAVLDGFISGVAALCAVRLCPDASGYLLGSHVSSEPAALLVLDEVGVEAPLRAGMHIGEGTGALTLLPLLDMAVSVYTESRSFEDTGMDAYEELT